MDDDEQESDEESETDDGTEDDDADELEVQSGEEVDELEQDMNNFCNEFECGNDLTSHKVNAYCNEVNVRTVPSFIHLLSKYVLLVSFFKAPFQHQNK